MRILRSADRVPVPWKNGQGLTREIAAHPAGAGLDDFDWRISMATVSAGGPFSIFPEVDRVLTVLAGRVALAVEDRDAIPLDTASPPFAFAGDAATQASVLKGPVVDLNVMVRRHRYAAEVRRTGIFDRSMLASSGTTVLFLESADATVRFAGVLSRLVPGDAILFERSDTPEFAVDLDGTALLIQLRPLDRDRR